MQQSNLKQKEEYDFVEKPAIDLFRKLGYNYIHGTSIDKESQHFFLFDILRKKIKQFNRFLDGNEIEKIVREISLITATSNIEANQKLYYKLVNYLSVKKDLGKGKKGQTVKIIDWDNVDRNEFTVVNQFYVKNGGFELYADLVVFVNGIPVSIIECKAPTLEHPMDEAIKQINGYKEINPKLFYPNQILVGLSKYQARYTTTYTPAKYFSQWKIPYPKDDKELLKFLGKKRADEQDVLIYSVFNKASLLDLIRNYIVFEADDNKLIKKLARYNQFIASCKTIKRLEKNEGGVVWHTQGSGKSLAMVYTALKLKKIGKVGSLNNPCIVILTDRIDLDDQIAKTFKKCNAGNPILINTVKKLREELSNPEGKIIFTTIQKFVTPKGEIHPELSKSKNIVVFTDEAHRTNYGELALNLRTAIPNSKFIAFTGTPIDKEDKSTENVFGTYIDKYLPRQAVDDGATINLKYQKRLNHTYIKGSEIDVEFDSEFKDHTDEEKERIKKKFVSYKTIAENEKRITDICKDIINHYNNSVRPEGFKAQIVTYSKKAAVTYKRVLDKLKGPKSEVIISSTHNDPKEIREHHKSKSEQKEAISKFKKPHIEEDLSILIVCDMLLTGFDAPIEQVMYLDKPLREHNLMQAIARVNRTYKENKTFGLIIDYCGIEPYLIEALKLFSDKDFKEFIEPIEKDKDKAEQAQNKVKTFFSKVSYKKGSPKYFDECIYEVLKAKDTRIRFEQAFKEFVIYTSRLMPSIEANKFKAGLFLFGKIYEIMRQEYGIKNSSVIDASEKVKKIVNDHLVSEGTMIIHEPIGIYSEKFKETLSKAGSDKAKASMMVLKIRTTINNLTNKNPIHYTSLREKLEKIIKKHEDKLINDAELLEESVKIRDNLDTTKKASAKNLNNEEFAIFKLVENDFLELLKEDSLNYEVSKEFNQLSKDVYSKITEYQERPWKDEGSTLQKSMLRDIKRCMYTKIKGFQIKEYDILSKKIMELARAII